LLHAIVGSLETLLSQERLAGFLAHHLGGCSWAFARSWRIVGVVAMGGSQLQIPKVRWSRDAGKTSGVEAESELRISVISRAP
jgi:hypothetical protein